MANIKWTADLAHTEVNFKVRHMMISNVSGNFKTFNATMVSDTEDLSKPASVEFEADIDSINTANEQRDGHLKSADFFDAENYPKLIIKTDDFKNGKVMADVTIRGTTKQIPLNVEFFGIVNNGDSTSAGFEITGEISRKEFGLNWNQLTEAGGAVVSDKVKVDANVEFIKQA
ncbi:MAG: YceI family protein [Brumimicrobium sp.]